MTMLQTTHPTRFRRSQYRSGDAQWPHVGECTSAGIAVLHMVEQRNGGRVCAAGDAR